jgi:hypothetical protein
LWNVLLQVRSGFGCDPEAAGLVGDVLPGIGTSPLHHHGEAAIKLSGQNINYVKQVVRSWSHSCTIHHGFLTLKLFSSFFFALFPHLIAKPHSAGVAHSIARWVSAADVPQIGVR